MCVCVCMCVCVHVCDCLVLPPTSLILQKETEETIAFTDSGKTFLRFNTVYMMQCVM